MSKKKRKVILIIKKNVILKNVNRTSLENIWLKNILMITIKKGLHIRSF